MLIMIFITVNNHERKKKKTIDAITHSIHVKKSRTYVQVIPTLRVRYVDESNKMQKYQRVFVANLYNHIILL